jgi:hypothetical protein
MSPSPAANTIGPAKSLSARASAILSGNATSTKAPRPLIFGAAVIAAIEPKE